MAKKKSEPGLKSTTEVDEALFVARTNTDKAAALRAEMDEKIAAIADDYRAAIRTHEDTVEFNLKRVADYCKTHREELTEGGKTKTVRFTHGTVSWRTGNWAVNFKKGVKAELIIDKLKENGLTNFVRTVEEVNREAIITEATRTRKEGEAPFTIIPEVTVTRSETLSVELKQETGDSPSV